MSYLQKYEPSGRSGCMCGSGKRFKNCCKKDYSKKEHNGTELYNSRNYKKALKVTRNHITWYRLCHQAHTVELLKVKPSEVEPLLKTDIEALADLLDFLLDCNKLDTHNSIS